MESDAVRRGVAIDGCTKRLHSALSRMFSCPASKLMQKITDERRQQE
jgi:hypothetical protein